ncbi:NACHT and WD40 domain protein [Penicillium robsamsonii]|uniref:NACHT and WD40 domain protein n=1 Tax=Penicillium robsamsonii TaxID=1792511 RepID=UPI002549A0F8|nr:NACHT and WD40 domain protein [Penicillium robsamsonii]KAJ5816310.1 NACHT and WD40 domain protein [Penicillium robsamsonii]
MASSLSFHNPNFGTQTGINNGTINAQFDLRSDPLDMLPIADGAVFDSYANQHQDKCLPGTRSELLNEIAQWAMSSEGKCIFWLNGMAGTGKSTVSRTVANRFEEEKLLGASFFFKRGEGDRGNAIKLFPTITKQLAKVIPQLTSGVRKAIDNNPDIGTKGLKEQFDRILLQPLLDLHSSTLPTLIVVIVIDALDECDVDNDMRLILQLLPQLQKAEGIRVRVLLTSRPELPIRLGFDKLPHHDHKDFVLHNIPKEVIENDLSLFLNHRISKIREEREPPLPIDWPGAINIRKLVALSVPLFIFAATICRIFEDPDWDPMDSLPEILTHQNDESKLDGTYLPVLDRLLKRQSEKKKKELVQEFHEVVGAIVILESPLSIIALPKLIGLPQRLVHTRLNSLHSVLSVPNDETSPIQLFHLSFRDFLLSPETREKTVFWIDEKEMHHRLSKRCFLICENLRRNICELPSDGTQRENIDRQTINRFLPPELQYACRYWAHHLVLCIDMYTVVQDVLLFLKRHFLHWVEAMSLLGLTSEVVGIINRLEAVIAGDHNAETSEFLHDAKRFILKNRQIADEAPLQVYCSGLIFAPRKAIIRKEFKVQLPSWIYQLPQVQERWSAELQALQGHSSSVQSVAFSPNGQLLASGSLDKTLRLWDTATGALQQTLEGHTDWVESVAFSPDGRLLASSSNDKTICLWDTAIGALQQTLKGHTDSVQSVTFSPDGQLLASGSDDETVRLWDTATGALQQTLKGHTDWVQSVAFSPDGRLLASSSDDKTILLWDTARGALQQTLEGHTDSVQSVTFSPDGQLLASGSDDETVRLWETATGALQQTLEGHTDWVQSVAFSPDGRLLASSSDDKTTLLWDTATGVLQQILEGHINGINSVAFSPDGRLLASGSDDETVRLWDTATGTLQQTLEGHTDWVQSVAFSPDGRLLASGSRDKTVGLWDMATDMATGIATGALQQTLEGHTESVQSVAFSPDGRLLASGSDDETVRLWDTATGVLQQVLEGHTGWVQSVTFSPDGRLLASSSEDKTVRLWDIATGVLQQTLEGHTESVQSVAFSPDGRLLASGSDDEIVRLWDTATGALQQAFEGHTGWVQSVTFSPDGRLLASSSDDKTILLWDTATRVLQQTLEGHTDWVQSVAFSPDSRLLASGSDDETVRLWDTTTGVLLLTLKAHTGWVRSVTFSPDGRLLASSSDDKIVRLWNMATAPLQQNPEYHTGWVRSLAFSPDGQLLASGSDDETVRLWETATGALQQTLEGHTDWVQSVAFSPDGRLLASSSDDKTILLWDTATGALQQTLEGHTESVQSVAFSPDGRLLASGSDDETVRLWDTATGVLQQVLEGHTGLVRSVAFSPDGRLLASGSNDRNVRLWDTATGALYEIFRIHSVATDLEFSQDGTYLSSNPGSPGIKCRNHTPHLSPVNLKKSILKIPRHSSYTSCNSGSLGIQSKCRNHTSNTHQANLDISIIKAQWIIFNGEKILWLPPDAGPSCSAIKGSTLALGHASGRISFIGFRV